MKYSQNIDKARAEAWGLNHEQAALFDFLLSYFIRANDKGDVMEFSRGVAVELEPPKVIARLTPTIRSAARVYDGAEALEKKGLIELESGWFGPFYRITDKGWQWKTIGGEQ